MKSRIEKWKSMVDSNNPDAQAYLEEITAQAKAEGKIGQMGAAADYLMASASRRMDAVEASIAEYTLHEQMGELSEVINLAYIARHYFGKTRQWLYQRLKGQTVNGKPAAFTPAEELTFKNALSDIGLQIATFTQRV